MDPYNEHADWFYFALKKKASRLRIILRCMSFVYFSLPCLAGLINSPFCRSLFTRNEQCCEISNLKHTLPAFYRAQGYFRYFNTHFYVLRIAGLRAFPPPLSIATWTAQLNDEHLYFPRKRGPSSLLARFRPIFTRRKLASSLSHNYFCHQASSRWLIFNSPLRGQTTCTISSLMHSSTRGVLFSYLHTPSSRQPLPSIHPGIFPLH